MKAEFVNLGHKLYASPFVLQSNDEVIGISISGDDSCGEFKNYSRLYTKIWDKRIPLETYTNGFDQRCLVEMIAKITQYEAELNN